MPDVHLTRHGDRWALSDAAGEAPFFESYTREEAEAEARRRAGDGKIHWAGDDDGRTAVGQDQPAADRDADDAPSPDELRPHGAPGTPAEAFRETQGGL
jgi:hypothetical protein